MTKPTLDADRRGVSEVIGSILVFGLVIMLVSLLQVQAIPNANEEVEFEHNNKLTNDMADLRVAMSQSLDSGRAKETKVGLGVGYPSRLIFYNPPPSSGTLRTTEQGQISIRDATGDGVLGEYLANNPELSTRSLTYGISYNEYGSSPERVHEPAVYYEEFDDEMLVKESTFIDGREITLVAIGGDFSANGVTAEKIAAKPLSAPMTERTIRGEGSQSIKISVPTKLSKMKWDEILSDEYSDTTSPLTGKTGLPGDGYVEDATYTNNAGTYNTLEVTLKTGEDYTLRAGKVGFGTGGEVVAKYLVPVKETPGRATVEVRDEFNNPVANQEVTFHAPSGTISSGGTTGSTITVETGNDGRVSVVRESGKATSVTAEYDLDGDGQGQNGIEPIEQTQVYFNDGVVIRGVTGDPSADTVTLELDNRDASKRISSIEVDRITQYDSQFGVKGPGNVVINLTRVTDGPDGIDGMNINRSGSTSGFTATEATGPVPLSSPLFVPEGPIEVELSLDGDYVSNSDGDSLALRVTLTFDDGTSETYDVQLFENEK